MGKRSDFVRNPRDFYPTPLEAVMPLIAHLPTNFKFIEPCAGDGALVAHLEALGGSCVSKSDIEPLRDGIDKMNALDLHSFSETIITNPPWDRKILHPMIEHFTQYTDCWLLFDADWAHTRQSTKYVNNLSKIVSVGRVKWIPNSKMTGKDNCCWYYFTKHPTNTIEFVGRT